MTDSLSIAVVGGGVAGIVAAYLLQQQHNVTLYEANDKLGGHTNTVEIPRGPDEGMPVDTGFIVFNLRNYPQFNRFLAHLDVEYQTSDMSFSYADETSGEYYAGTGLGGLFAQNKRLFDPRHYRLIWNIVRYGRKAHNDLNSVNIKNQTLQEYFEQNHFPTDVVEKYFYPMGAAIWSSPKEAVASFPAQAFLSFFTNHGLLRLYDMPVWQTVQGGSQTYVKAFEQQFNGVVHTNCPIERIERDQEGVAIHAKDKPPAQFNKVVIATHADQALQLLSQPSESEQNNLGTWHYSQNHTVLHTDERVMPPARRAWASWNYKKTHNNQLAVTYHMNRLQSLQTQQDYFVSLNSSHAIDEEKILYETWYTHPIYTFSSMESQPAIRVINGEQHTYYCGSYLYNGFHEDAVRSAVDVANHFGIDL